MTDYRAIIVADLGFGDAGKGTTIDYLARRGTPSTVVRFNGGAQAAHNVITPDGVHHTFSQFGSGTFVPGVRTHLTRFVLFDPIELAAEAQRLEEIGCDNPFRRFTVDREALVVTLFHKMANRIRERIRGAQNHGTCGFGIGETMSDSFSFASDTVRAKDLQDVEMLTKKFKSIQERKREELKEFFGDIRRIPEAFGEVQILEDTKCAEMIAGSTVRFAQQLQIVLGEILKRFAHEGDLLFEGAQGVLLDEWYGFHPHTTWSTTTFENAETLLDEIGYQNKITKLGVLRAYHTRHGVGPFVTYDKELSALFPDRHNGAAGWQGEFRVGWFDLVMACYAQDVARADSLVITHLDRYATIQDPQVCVGYRVKGSRSRVSRLPLGKNRNDLAFQESLTNLLRDSSPIYERSPQDIETYIQMIEQELRIPVTITSYGTTALDKRLRHSI